MGPNETEVLLAYLGFDHLASPEQALIEVRRGRQALALLKELIAEGALTTTLRRRAGQLLDPDPEPPWMNRCTHEEAGLPGCDVCDPSKREVRKAVLAFFNAQHFSIAGNIIGEYTQIAWDGGARTVAAAELALRRKFKRWEVERLDRRRPPPGWIARHDGLVSPDGLPDTFPLADAWRHYEAKNNPPLVHVGYYNGWHWGDEGQIYGDTEKPECFVSEVEAREAAWKWYWERLNFPPRITGKLIITLWPMILSVTPAEFDELWVWSKKFRDIHEQLHPDVPWGEGFTLSIDDADMDALVNLPLWRAKFQDEG